MPPKRSVKVTTPKGSEIEPRISGRERADLVLSGCAILDAICATWPVGRLRVADRGIREGILFDLMHGDPAEA